jgi:signal transduction histidine kinase
VDDGPGFPPGATDQAFERFYRGDIARSGGGSGLGLAIVRELARAHGGTAIAENLVPHGARVSVVLPVAPPLVAPRVASAVPPVTDPRPASF